MVQADLERHGFAVVPDALSGDETTRLLEAVDRVYRERAEPGEPLHELGFLGLDETFLELVAHEAVLPEVRRALGWNIYLYHCHLDVHPPVREAVAEPWRWHQDGGRQNLELESPRPRLSLKVAYFLTDVRSRAEGCLWVIPGSHVHDVLHRPADGSVRPPGAEPLLVEAGTAVIFDRRLWHARGDNRSERTRKALFYAYTYRWVRERDELGLNEKQLAKLDPITRQLLGASTNAVGYWIPTEEDVPLRAAMR
jgi:ectoine hydroxylase